MIYAVFGMPGSGKSYYVVNEFIVKRISSGTVISNIALSDDVHISDNYIYLDKYSMDNLHLNIAKIMDNSSKSHDEKKVLLSYLFGLYGSGDITLIVDECHLYGYRGRSSNISYIDDFLSIHRHIFEDRKMDIILITQVPSRLNTEIAAQVEIAVKAVPASQRLITSMLEYSVFGSVDALKKNDVTMRMKRQIIKGDKKVFELYQSGFIQKGSNDFRKKLILIASGVAASAGFVVYQFMGLTSGESFGHRNNNETVVKSDHVINTENNITAPLVHADYILICRPYIEGLDYEKIKGFMYAVKKDKKVIKYCYRSYLNG